MLSASCPITQRTRPAPRSPASSATSGAASVATRRSVRSGWRRWASSSGSAAPTISATSTFPPTTSTRTLEGPMSDLEHVIDTTDVEEAGVQPANLPATTRDAQAIMGMLDRLIGDPSFDVLKAEKLMDLYARAADRQAAQDYQIG